MFSQTKTKITPADYLASERASDRRHEFLDGAIFAMAGASKKHNQISSNLVRIIGNQILTQPCNVYASDMRVKSDEAKKYTYPDIVVACENEHFEDDKEDTLLNPILIIEILSASTEAYDRGDKFFHYRQIASFVEYVLVSQKSRHIERYVRQPNHAWLYSEFKMADDNVRFSAIGCTASLEEIYNKVKIDISL